MDEREFDDEPYCVLDVPHRFWTWVREYVGHVDAKLLRDFDQQFFARYRANALGEFFVNEPFAYAAADAAAATTPKSGGERSMSTKKRVNGALSAATAAAAAAAADKQRRGSNARKSSRPTLLNGARMSNGKFASRSNGGGGGGYESAAASTRRGKFSSAEKPHINGTSGVAPLPSSPPLPPPLKLNGVATEHAADLMKRLVAAYVQERASDVTLTERHVAKRRRLSGARSPPQRRLSKSTAATRSRLSLMAKAKKQRNGHLHATLNGRLSNGIKTETTTDDDESHEGALATLSDELLSSIGAALADCVGGSGASAVELTDDEDDDEEEEEEEAEEAEKVSVGSLNAASLEPTRNVAAAAAAAATGLPTDLENYKLIKLHLGAQTNVDLSTDLVCLRIQIICKFVAHWLTGSSFI